MFGWIRTAAARVRGVVSKRAADKDFTLELQTHLAMLTEENISRGMAPEEAQRAARVRLGGVAQLRETHSEQWGFPLIETFFQDIHYALRMLRKNPGFTAVAVLTLALGIGANAAIFSVVDAVLLRPLPFPDPDRVVTFWPLGGIEQFDEANGPKTLESAAIYMQGDLNASGGGTADRIPAAEVSRDFFRVFGLHPILGRTFLPTEEKTGNVPVVILSAGLWQSRFQRDASVLGKTLNLNGRPFTVIGVLPEGFDFPAKARLWVPLPAKLQDQLFGGNAFVAFEVARLRNGVALSEARSELQVIAQNAARPGEQATIVTVKTLQQSLLGDRRQAVLLLFGAVGLVLLIACADVANLLLSRGAGRAREVAIRRALGATRARLIRQFLVESVLLSLLGGAFGLLGGWWAISAARALVPDQAAFAATISLDRPVLLFLCAIALLTGVLAGIVPALHSTASDWSEGLKEDARSSPRGFGFRSRRNIRSLLGVCEIALALILVTGAILFLRSFGHLLEVDPGYRTTNILTARLSLLGPKYNSLPEQAAFFQEVLSRVRIFPHVQAAGIVNAVPLGSSFVAGFNLVIENASRPASGPVGALYSCVSTDYFRAMNIPLIAGRDFTDSDVRSANLVVIVSKSLAESAWPGRNPIGLHLAITGDKNRFEVIGIAGDVRQLDLSDDAMPQMYLPLAQNMLDDATLVIRTDSDPLALDGGVRDAVRAVDPEEPVASFSTMEGLLSKSVAGPHFRALLLGIFGGLALLLALVGIFGVVSYAVVQRTHEIGVRVTLGAQRRDILRIVAGYGLRLAALGLAIGLGGAYFLARLASSFLYGIQPTDPLTFAVSSVVLLAVVLLASYVPTRRALHIDPMVALRYE